MKAHNERRFSVAWEPPGPRMREVVQASARYLRECVRPAGQEGLKRGGRSRADFTFRASTMVVLGDTEEELRKNARAVKKQIADNETFAFGFTDVTGLIMAAAREAAP